MKQWRQSQILDVVDREAVVSQEILRQRLQARGIDATQATISRDLKDLGLVKRAGDGAYIRPGSERPQPGAGDQLRRALMSLLRGYERVDPLLVLRTDRGQAQGLAEWIDRAHLAEVAGTIAGDDTILLVCRGAEAAATVEARLGAMVGRQGERTHGL
jgi:transcriptional regulator of arginine metabolism